MSARGAVLLLATLALVACGGGASSESYPVKVFVFGFDGMEPSIVEAEMAAGRMPNFARLAEEGGFSRLGTSLPPESPVAWANFNTGFDPGGHGIFDFIHSEETESGVKLQNATSRSADPSSFISLFGYRLPLDRGGTELTVQGTFFWERLARRGIPVSIVRVPSNYPPRGGGARTFSGMGTPDLLGSYGVFSYYTDDPPLNALLIRRSGSGHIMVLDRAVGPLSTVLRGPRNVCLAPVMKGSTSPYATVPLRIYPDAERGAARIDVDDRTVVLSVGEWSDWVPVRFPFVPGLYEVPGMVRLYLKEVAPHVRLYVSPVNVDPLDPVVQISTPPDAARELAQTIGRFYTQGMAEDTQAHRFEIFDTDEFLAQAELVLEERRRMLDYEVERFNEVGGATFFYFSTTDLVAHMLFRHIDEEHPGYTLSGGKRWGGKLVEVYREMDRILGEAVAKLPADTRVVVMSDHGFKSFRRELSLNTWLKENGFLFLRRPDRQGQGEGFNNVDFTRTKAYAVGFSGIHLNHRACPDPEKTKEAIIRGLLELRDPKDGASVVKAVHRREDVYHGKMVPRSPDLIVGFDLHYGCAEASVLGTVPRELFSDVLDAWSGSHLMDPSVVPGIFLVNSRIEVADPQLLDLTKSILMEFGIDAPELPGRRVWARKERR